MALSKKKSNKKRSGSPSGRKGKAGFTPQELRLGKRFLSSLAGKLVIGGLVALILPLLSALIAGGDPGLFFLLNGLALLLAMIAFWFLLLFRRRSRPD